MSENQNGLSREAYRRQQQQAEQELLERDKKRLRAEREYAKNHPDSIQDEPDLDEPTMTRSGRDKPLNTNEKITKLKSKLNLVIGGLVIAIVAVYLILFFVG